MVLKWWWRWFKRARRGVPEMGDGVLERDSTRVVRDGWLYIRAIKEELFAGSDFDSDFVSEM
jgi:hypothetical protein